MEHIIAATDIEDDFWVGAYRSETPGGKIILSDGRRKIKEPETSGGQTQSSGGQGQNSGGQGQNSGGQVQNPTILLSRKHSFHSVLTHLPTS